MISTATLIAFLACNFSTEPTVTVTTRPSPKTTEEPNQPDEKTGFESVFEVKPEDWETVPRDYVRAVYKDTFHPKWSGDAFLHLSAGHYILADTTPRSNDRRKRAFHLSTYERESRIPLLVYTPGDPNPGPNDQAVNLQHVGATLYDMLGMQMPENVAVDPLEVHLPEPPKFIMVMVYDALSWAHWDRYLAKKPVHAGLRAASREWTQTRLGHMSSSTTVSHSVLSTGQAPRYTGIPINHSRTGTGLYEEVFVGERPERLLVPTVADLYDAKHDNKPIIASFCSQSRAAIAMAGHGLAHPMGDADFVVWQENYHGALRTNTTYWSMPDYMEKINPEDLLKEVSGQTFNEMRLITLRHMFRSPHTIKIGEQVVNAWLDNEPFGQDEFTDLMFINQKVLDNIAHRMSADTESFRDALDALDEYMGRLLDTLNRKFGDDYTLILTSDHGFGPRLALPSKVRDPRRVDLETLIEKANETLGVPGLVEDVQYLNIYLNRDKLKSSGKSLDDVCTVFSALQWVEYCITKDELTREDTEK